MNNKEEVILTNSYVPTRPKLYDHDEIDLHTRFLISNYNSVISDPDGYFEKAKFINFDVINNVCRGDKLEHSVKYYETLFKKKVDEELSDELHKNLFVSAAHRSERENLHLERELYLDHLKAVDRKEQLKQKGIYLSSMQKCKKCTDQCKSLPF